MRKSIEFLGRRIGLVLVFGLAGSLLLALAELSLAALLPDLLGLLGLSLTVERSLFQRLVGDSESVLVFFIGIVSLRAIGQFVVNYTTGLSIELIQDRLKRSAIAALLFTNSRPEKARVHSALADLSPKAAAFANFFTQLTSITIQMTAILLMLFVNSPKETGVAILLLFIVGAFIVLLNRRVRVLASALPAKQGEAMESLERIIDNWLLVLTLNTRRAEYRKISNQLSGYLNIAKKSHALANLAASVAPVLGALILIFTCFLSLRYLGTASNSLITFLYLFVRLIQNIASLGFLYGMCNTHLRFFLEAADLFAIYKQSFRSAELTLISSSELNSASPALKVNNSLPVAIRFDNVVFSYETAGDALFNGFNLFVSPGSQLAIIGPSGSGKSTLLFLLLGIQKPKCGSVLLNEQIADSESLGESFRVAYVGPEPYLFEGTLTENLLYGSRQPVGYSEMCHILAMLNIFTKDQISQPSFLESSVTASGANFSTGQRQRICLARAILSKPNLLVLDEASANLDIESEKLLADVLKDLKGICTTVIVSHRKGLIVHADQLIDLSAR